MTTLVNRILRSLLPVRCTLCGALTTGAALCEGCNADLPWLDPAGAQLSGAPEVFAALSYEYPVDRLIVAAKFHRRLSHARVLGELLADFLGKRSASRGLPDVLVPVPLHDRRLATRGYNQALEIARPIASEFYLPLRSALLRRTRATAEQSGLTGEERRRNVAGCFAVAGDCRGLRIALVDDVVTTGSTAGAAALALHRAGAVHCEIWAVALARPTFRPA